MKVEKTHIDGLLVITPTVFDDERGHFFESFRKDTLKAYGVETDFVQDNQSLSSKGILRGLHFQKDPHAQGKLVRVLQGSVVDVAVDIRPNSLTYGQHFSIELNESNKTMFYIPPGFAHGFVSLEDDTIISYKCTNSYSKEHEGCVLWNDLDLGIDWEIDQPLISPKDQEGTLFKDFISPF